ncbi:unnamed protein product [Pseudo-nitzschia multistriata]|uniref:Uncharacterized protein n=1 Tax=Pseudo-nitzschia multistriata TaxID=183589 RepID=A0A448YWI0_9STRA|nr:unnamed protein product [Pseudo-nitzschia multistriata]
MKRASKRPSEWLKLLCREWAETDVNLELIETVDDKFESYKPYMKGKLSSQLLCRLCIPSDGDRKEVGEATNKPDFLKNVLGIEDDFDRAYVIAQVERFCDFYDIRGIRQQAEAPVAGANASAVVNNNNNSNNNNRFVVPNNEATAAAAAALYGDIASLTDVHQQAIAAAAAATAANHHLPHQFLTADATAAAVAAAQQAVQQQDGESQHHKSSATKHSHTGNGSDGSSAGAASSGAMAFASNQQHTNKTAQALLTKAQQQAKSAERALEHERRQNAKREQRRLSQDKKLARQRDREFLQKQKQAEKLARERAREEKRTRKLLQRQERERFAQEQKEAALRRAADLVASNRVPIEITRAGGRGRGRKSSVVPRIKSKPGSGGEGNEMVKSSTAHNDGNGANHSNGSNLAANAAVGPKKRQRSAIIVSTASDLDRIVTHSQNLWAKYNAIAKEHNQRVNWITVAKDLGIHVKVREKYARMHSRACQRNFDFVANGHWKIKDHPEIFQEPTPAEQKARMPPPLPPPVQEDERSPEADHQALGAQSVAIVEEHLEKEVLQLSNNNTSENTMGLTNDQNENAVATSIVNDNNARIISNENKVAAVSGHGSEGEAPVCVKEEGVVGRNTITNVVVGNTNGQPTTSSSAVGTAPSPIPPPHDPLDAAAAAATAAAVVDAAGVGGAAIDMHHVAAVAAATAEGAGSAAAATAVTVGGSEDVVVGYGI